LSPIPNPQSLIQNRFWGLLIAHNCSEPRQWQQWEIDLLSSLATQVAIAIEQSALFKQVQELNANLERQVQKRTTQLQQSLGFEAVLKRITDKVRDSLDESQICLAAVRELALSFYVGSCHASLYNLEQDTATICYEYTISMPSSKGRVLQMKFTNPSAKVSVSNFVRSMRTLMMVKRLCWRVRFLIIKACWGICGYSIAQITLSTI